jgi:hypothetical protein
MGFRQSITGKKLSRMLRREQRVSPSNVPVEVEEMRVTTAKRLSHIDKFVIRVGKFDKSQPVKFLDVGCCPMLDGAPTTLSTKKAFRQAGYAIDITAVDKFFPKDFQPTDSKVNYASMDISRSAPKGKFDLVRASKIFEHIKGAENVRRAKENVFNAVNEGGLLVIDSLGKVVPEFGHKVRSGAGFVILKKVNGEMVFVKYIDPQSAYRSKRLGHI